MASVSGYLIGNRAAAGTPLVSEAEHQCRAGYDKYRSEFARLI